MTLSSTLRIALARFFRNPISSSGSGRAITIQHWSLPRRGTSRATVFWFVLVFLAMHVVLAAVSSDPRVRDPEYGRRASQLRARIAENPGRPLVLVLGSSRPAMGLRPSEWEATRPADPAHPDPLIFNMALIGSGPMMELMALRRIYADGFRPSLVLLEYWPPFLHHDQEWKEDNRVALDRLMDEDRQVVRDYFPDPRHVEADMNWRQRNPIWGYRERLLVQILSRWVPPEKRTDWTWDDLDGWGWKPGIDLEAMVDEYRTTAHTRCSEIYSKQFAAYQISSHAKRAFSETVALAREHGAEVGFVYLPESSEFRRLYPARVERMGRVFLDKMSRELNVPVMNCRDWVDDGFVVDGFHLSRAGAAAFTKKFGPAVAAKFPNLRTTPVQP